MQIDRKKITIQVLALIGLGLAIKLAFIYYAANYDKYSLSSFCSVNEFIDCDGVAKTNVAQFLGIPLAYWGIFFYLTVLMLTVVDKLKNIKFLKFLEVFKNPEAYIATLGVISFTVSMVLAVISLVGIKKLCVLCLATYFLDLFIALIASDNSFKKMLMSFKTTVVDFIAGVKNYTKTFVALVLLVIGFLTYSGVTLNFVPHIKHRKEIMKYSNIKYNPYRVKGNVLGSEDADVVIELYSDFVCPICYINNIMLHKAVKEFTNIKVVHYNYPFDKLCNPYIQLNMHPNACYMSRAAIAAKKQGNYWEMSSLLYENKPTKKADLLKLVEQLGFDKDRFLADMESKETQNEIASELNKAEGIDIDATPTMIINGEKNVGVKPYYELREILVKHGAKRK